MKILKMKPLTGRETSVLALLARSESLTSKEKKLLVDSLVDLPKRIGKVLIGGKDESKVVLSSAKNFMSWAKELRERTI